MNPLARLSPALFAALSGLQYDGQDVPVYEHLATPKTGYYLLLAKPKIAESGGRTGCKYWMCETTVDVITHFDSDAVSSEPADDLADAVLDRLDGQRLPFPANWDCMPGQLTTGDDEGDNQQEYHVVHRRLRFRYAIYYHGTLEQQDIPALLSEEGQLLLAEDAVAEPSFRSFFLNLFS